MSAGRRAAILAAALTAVLGVFLIGTSILGTQDPAGWLDEHATRIEDGTWTADEPPLAFAERMAAGLEPQSRYVDASGVALRYQGKTVTITAGTAEGTSVIYLDRRGGVARTYLYGRWVGGSFRALDGGLDGTSLDGGSSGGAVPAGAVASTRRSSDFRGGGPGSGK